MDDIISFNSDKRSEEYITIIYPESLVLNIENKVDDQDNELDLYI